MSNYRIIAAMGLIALVASGCGTAHVPDVSSSFSAETRNAAWPTFLPIQTVLSGDLTDISKADQDVQTMVRRMQRLKRRARILRAPVVDAQEKLRLEKAVERASG